MIIKGNTQLTQPLNPLWYVLFEHVRLDVNLPAYSAKILTFIYCKLIV